MADTEQLKQQLVSKLTHHDWYHDYSDDHSAWRRGRDSWDEIARLCRELGPAEARLAWDSVLDKIPEDCRGMFPGGGRP